MNKRIIPFVDHEIGYRLLQDLVHKASIYEYEIPAVVTTLGNTQGWWPSVDSICSKQGLPLFIYSEISIQELCKFSPDWLLLLSWKHIIPRELIRMPRNGVLNLHYSLLPKYRGVYPVNWSIIKGERRTGYTFHYVTCEIDKGMAFMQVEVPISLCDNARDLQLRIDDAVCRHLDEFIVQLLSSDGNSICISESLHHEQNSYFSRQEFKSTCELDLDRDYKCSELLNLLRGMSFFADSSNAYFVDKLSGKRYYVNIQIREQANLHDADISETG